MLKVFELVAWTVFFSTACLIPSSKGASAPWASNTDPTDVPKSQVQEVTTSPFTYNITQGGTMDGKMYNTLDGDVATFMPLRDNRTFANELDLVGGTNMSKARLMRTWGPVTQQFVVNGTKDR